MKCKIVPICVEGVLLKNSSKGYLTILIARHKQCLMREKEVRSCNENLHS